MLPEDAHDLHTQAVDYSDEETLFEGYAVVPQPPRKNASASSSRTTGEA